MGKIVRIEDLPADCRLELATSIAMADHLERTATAILKCWLHTGQLSRVLELPAITGYRWEFNVPGGRIDLLLFHSDRSMTIVETKPQGKPMEIAAGIGQLLMYANLLPKVLSARQQPTELRLALCAAIEPERCVELIRACAVAGVRFTPLPTLAVVREIVSQYAKRA